MAQLIKLDDCISRYEWNIYRYPSQFIRLKQENWKKLLASWESLPNEKEHNKGNEKEQSSIKKWFNMFKHMNEHEQIKDDTPATYIPATKQELKYYFLNKLLPMQLKWASSTMTEESNVNQKYMQDDTLQYLLQRFPDTYLVMYHPIFNIRNVAIEGEVILISPIGIDIITLLSVEQAATIHVVDKRTWEIECKQQKISRLSPIIALKRTEKIVSGILKSKDVSLPIRKVVLAKDNHIIMHSEPYQSLIIGKREYPDWFKQKRTLISPLKGQQLKAAGALLTFCRTTSVARSEWMEDNTNELQTIFREMTDEE